MFKYNKKKLLENSKHTMGELKRVRIKNKNRNFL